MNEKLRYGFTTGSCAAAASKAALKMLIDNTPVYSVTIQTPKGIPFVAEVVDIKTDEKEGVISCGVIKDGGDDPDVTTGAGIFASVALTDDGKIHIEGGKGVGRVTKPGLDQPVGAAAINSVPRRMIEENLREVLDGSGMKERGVLVTISVPEGEALADSTFNPRLGIVGGISILGTTGIVKPMSDDAIRGTIRAQIKVRRAEGADVLLAAPGNFGLGFLKKEYGIPEEEVVMCSNFIYDTVLMAKEEGFERFLLAGHIGKLVKVSGGIKNTHSRYGDHRMEILSDIVSDTLPEAYLSRKDDLICGIMQCVTTDEAVRIITEAGLSETVFDELTRRISEKIVEWADGKMEAEVILFASENTMLSKTPGAN